MTIKLYHCALSRSIRPLWTMEEMGLDYELEVMKFPPRFKYEGYTDINPVGTVPFYTDGNVQMTESVAISQYLVDIYGPTNLAVLPREKAYANYLNWIHRSDATLTFPLTLHATRAGRTPRKTGCRRLHRLVFLAPAHGRTHDGRQGIPVR